MDLNFRTRGRRARAAAGLAVAAVATVGAVGLLSACGQSSHTSAGAAGDITPGPGRHQMAGMPGAAGAGQGSAPSTPSMPGMSMPMSPPSTAAPVVPANGHTVAIRNFAFSPATLKVKAGTKVTWTNEDTDAHTVTSSGAGGPLHSAALATHGSYSYTFTKPGTYAYLCTIHPFMTATVEVTR
ncbi:cupredoxin domain-containing protein [Streptacidiphilus griseoplanus]|uniref:cupredoxin domain-containing protein n=1 Tax=Peterkaempfera griseoplana TaxID=66896 RepID=UPI000B0FF79E|nr:cupredoxin family copper-binding protein [Peterkaempfera griseoplana]